MPNFNLADYEPVEERLERFHKQYKEGRVITELVSKTEDTVMFKALLFRSFEEEKPWATGYAEETKGQNGPVNQHSHVENCETSAIGRALANAGYAPKGKRPSREEMTKVARSEEPAKKVGFESNVSKETWGKGRPSPEQVKSVINKAIYRKEQGKLTDNEVSTKWNAGVASDYIGNRITLDEAKKRVGIL